MKRPISLYAATFAPCGSAAASYAPGMAQLQPGPYLYFDVVSDEPTPVELRLVDKHTLGVFFEGRDDYDLVEEVSGRFEPDAKRERRAW